MKIIGLGHYSRTGKDTLAKFIVQHAEAAGSWAARMSFAWKLKRICHDLYAWDGLREPEFYDTPEGAAMRDVPLPTIGKTPVQIWVDFGTPAVREQVYDRTWIDYLLWANRGFDLLVIPDVRFPNEVEAIKEAGGMVVKVVRPGVMPRETVADQALVGYGGWDAVVTNDGSLDELSKAAAVLVKR